MLHVMVCGNGLCNSMGEGLGGDESSGNVK